jgi:hypothetical protein
MNSAYINRLFTTAAKQGKGAVMIVHFSDYDLTCTMLITRRQHG